MKKALILTLILFLSCTSQDKAKKLHPITEDLVSFASNRWPIHHQGYRGQERLLRSLIDTVYKDGVKEEVEALYSGLREAQIRYYSYHTLGGTTEKATSSRHYSFLFLAMLEHDSTDQMRIIKENNGRDTEVLTYGLSEKVIANPAVKKWFLEKRFHTDPDIADNVLRYISQFGAKEQKQALLKELPKIHTDSMKSFALKIYCTSTDSIAELKPLFRKINSFSAMEQDVIIEHYGKKMESPEELESLVEIYNICSLDAQGTILYYGIPFRSEKVDTYLAEYFQNKALFPDEYYGLFRQITKSGRGDLKPLIVKLKDEGRFYKKREYQKLIDTLSTF